MKRFPKEYVPNAAAAARRAKARRKKQSPIETTKTNPDWRKMPRKRPDKDIKHTAYSILIAHGVKREKAAELLGYCENTARSLDRAIEQKSLNLGLLSEQRIKKAYRVIDKCLAGKAFGDEPVKASTALRAAEMILDRSHPKREEISPPAHNYTVYNLDFLKPDHPNYHLVYPHLNDPISPVDPAGEAVDVTPDSTPRMNEDSS